ncbi:MAG: peptidoglycan editing factor PgeF [Candidatus Omnitrophica bacterium]|nr:peptidoglycan editing factor PgeF [Candidatus Omnitrophota bacterium]
MSQSAEVVFGFSNRTHRNMSLHYGDTAGALDNRIGFLSGLGIDHRKLVCAKQVHGDSVRVASRKDSGCGALTYESAIADTDAFVTDKLNLPLAIFTADCLSIFIYDPETPAIGLAHAGWRSTHVRIVEKTIKLMQEKFGTHPHNLIVTFGPSIRICCYEVGKEFLDFFPHEVTKSGGKYYLDLVRINKGELLESGVEKGNISDTNICTCCRNDRFFSFRKEGASCGRTMSVMMLR